MTTYGTIPTEPGVPQSPDITYISKAKERIVNGLGTRRPWKEMIQVLDINLPTTLGQLVQRTKINLVYFRMNYVIITLYILVLSLLWHPISLTIFVSVIVAWLVLYFLRTEPLVVCGRAIEDRALITGLIMVTMAALILTHVAENVIIALFMSVAAIFIHGGLRGTEDLFFVVEEEERVGYGGEDAVKFPLKHAASSSFSLP